MGKPEMHSSHSDDNGIRGSAQWRGCDSTSGEVQLMTFGMHLLGLVLVIVLVSLR